MDSISPTPRIGTPSRLAAARSVGNFFLIGIAVSATSQLALLLVARRLQPRGFGVWIVATTVFSIALLMADFGMQSLAVQQLSGRKVVDRLHQHYTRVSLELAMAVSASGLALFILVTIGPRSDYSAVPLMLCAALPATFVGNMAVKYRIRERFASASAAAEAVGVMALGALAGTVVRSSAVGASAGAVVAMYLLAALWWVLEPEERGGGARPFLRGPTRGLAREGRYFLASALCVALYSRGDRVVVAVIAGRLDAGLYGVAYSLVFAASLLSLALQSVTLPRLVERWRDRIEWRSYTLRFIGRLWLVGLLGGTVLVLISDRLILLLYGSSFSAAAGLVRILSPLVPLYFVNEGLGTCLIACGRQRTLARICAMNLGVGVLLYPVLTLAFGAAGAAAASVAVEAGGDLMLLWSLRPTLTASSHPA
jgi:O-antigen/teichoic acid export membrane protein